MRWWSAYNYMKEPLNPKSLTIYGSGKIQFIGYTKNEVIEILNYVAPYIQTVNKIWEGEE